MTAKYYILELQRMYFEIEDLQEYNLKHLEAMIQLMSQYQHIVKELFKRFPENFDNLFQIGLEEIYDHVVVLNNATAYMEKTKCFSDLHFYFQQSVLDARAKLVQDYIRG